MKTLLTLLLFSICTLSYAQRFEPQKNTVTVVVPNAPGGPADSAGRIFADYLGKQGITAVAQNRPGAGGAVGAAYVASQVGNPYTVMVGFKTPVIFAPIAAAEPLTYNENTFQPVGMIGTLDLALVTSPMHVKSATTKDFYVEYQQNQHKINVGTFAGLFESYVTQLFEAKGIKPNVVIYKSSAQLLTDLAGGNVQLGLLDLNSSRALIADGKLGHISDFQFPANIQSWWGIYAAPGAAKEAVEFYSNMVMNMHKDPEYQERLKRAFNTPRAMNHIEFEQFHRAEITATRRWAGGAKR